MLACPNTKAATGVLEDEVELPNMPPPAEVADSFFGWLTGAWSQQSSMAPEVEMPVLPRMMWGGVEGGTLG